MRRRVRPSARNSEGAICCETGVSRTWKVRAVRATWWSNFPTMNRPLPATARRAGIANARRLVGQHVRNGTRLALRAQSDSCYCRRAARARLAYSSIRNSTTGSTWSDFISIGMCPTSGTFRHRARGFCRCMSRASSGGRILDFSPARIRIGPWMFRQNAQSGVV